MSTVKANNGSKQTPPLRKALSSPSIAGAPRNESVPFPTELQAQWAKMKEDPPPERWMCVVIRREKLCCAVGRLVQVDQIPT